MTYNYSQEIIELHQFFQDYFRGIIPFEAASRFDQTLATTFTIINANGQITDADAIKRIIRQLHGQRADIRIWIENIALRYESNDAILATYEEWQSDSGKTTQRSSTVLFKKDADTPNGLVWLHVHESGLREL